MQEVRPIGQDAVHVVVDMQDIFADRTVWHTPSIPVITPAIRRLVTHRRDRAIFTRFITPHTADETTGAWQAYYRRWTSVTTSSMNPDLLDVMSDFLSFVPPAHVIDKTTYSAFESDAFVSRLKAMACQTLIVSGVETDVCVLATVMTGVDRGYRMIIAQDAVGSSNNDAHRAMLDFVYRRFEDQIEISTSAEIIAAWQH